MQYCVKGIRIFLNFCEEKELLDDTFILKYRNNFKIKKNEFEKFIVDLSTGLFQVVRISHKSFNFYSERIISKLLNQKTKGIYVFARGDEFVEKLDIVKDSLNSSIIKDIEITDNGVYTWKNKNKKTKAKTLIVKIKR